MIKFFTLLVLSATLFNQVLSVPCNCGLGRGVNACSQQHDDNGRPEDDSSLYPLVVRPQTLPKVEISEMTKPGTVTYEKILTGESNIAPLKPIGDMCSCGKTIITPAYVPKPACSGCGGGGITGSTSSSGSSFSSSSDSTSVLEAATSSAIQQALQGSSSSSQFSTQSEQVGNIRIDFPVCGLPVVPPSRPVYYGSQVPADEVSRAIAYQRLQKPQPVEYEVQFGFKTMPKEPINYVHKKKTTFHEDNIYRQNGDVLELGKVYHAPTVDEVAVAELEEEEEEPEIEVEPVKVQHITLGSLGFVPMNTPKTRFTNVVVEPQPHYETIETSPCGIDAVPQCNDGYRGGQVVIKDEPVYSEHSHVQHGPVVHSVDEANAKYISEPVYSYSSNPHSSVIGSSHSSTSRTSSSSSSHNSYYRRGGCL